ncbi:hypothetical protein N7474_005196 [Penicillium riverlandense]|uniref:uncharacterized protein n=1 Tax=Penicillium riverlandense TaxID=1903569 RepID=UPI002548A8D9|nr:uncharacterized protein N7474_005196 [Penicillium riverlandense]KAJ5819605.1 hypothetical protein N7474_005196 [Penicillium riverlandense]
MAPPLKRIRDVIRSFIERDKTEDAELLKLAKDLEKEAPLPSLAISSLNLGDVQVILNLKFIRTDPELSLVPSIPLTPALNDQIELIDEVLNNSVSNEASIRWKLNALMMHAHRMATADKTASNQPISIQTESLFSMGPVVHDEQQWTLTGRPDYTVWYGNKDHVSLNVVVVEAKCQQRGLTGLPQALAYMGVVHHQRKKLGKRDSTVYGVTCDDVEFRFLKLNDNSEWSEKHVTAREQQYEQAFGLLVFLMKKALSLSPIHSKESSAQTYDTQGSSHALGSHAEDLMDEQE